MASLSKVAQEEALHDTQQMVYMFAWKSVKKYGGSFEDWHGVCNEAWVVAWKTYDLNGEAKFTTWLYSKLFHLTQNEVKRRMKVGCEHLSDDIEAVPQSTSNFSLQEFLEQLSTEAQTIVATVFDCSQPFQKPASCARAAREALKKKGWTTAMIKKAFSEVQMKLMTA